MITSFRVSLPVLLAVGAAPLGAAGAQSRAVTAAPTAARATAIIEGLHGAMPSSFDIYPDDSCAGVWAVDDPVGAITVSVFRYQRLPLVHVRHQDGAEGNAAVQRLGAHTIKFRSAGATYTMQCTGSAVLVDRAVLADGQLTHQQIAAREAPPSTPDPMNIAGRQSLARATVSQTREPDGTDDCRGERPRKQTSSLDGGYVYQQLCRAPTTDVIVQIRKSGGQRRQVTFGNSLAVIRNGPWRGMLLVSKHKYKEGDQGGSYDATWVVRPDGKEMFQVPGTEDGDDRQVEAWLRSKGWVAN